jgi:myo-inositol 2-dehydrogenase / D-chiro-inositol 1-dehydrogenase
MGLADGGFLKVQRNRGHMKLGVIGCGWVTEHRHLPALRQIKDAEVIALSDISVERLNKVATLFHVKDRYTRYQHLLEDESIDAVAVCGPAHSHIKMSIAALDAGKHVFIEKPLALRLDECDGLMKRAEASSKKVMVGFNLRWHRLLRKAQALVARGVLGKPQSIRSILTSLHEKVPEWRKLRASGGGVLFEQAVHDFDLWHFLLRSEVEEIFVLSRSSQWEDEAATVTGSMRNGVLVSSLFSQRTASNNEIEIYGENGILRISCYRFDGFEFVPNGTHSGDLQARLRRMVQLAHFFPDLPYAWRQGGDFVASYRAEWQHFIDSIQDGLPLECTLEDGYRALEVVSAAVDSVSLGKPIRLIYRSEYQTRSRGTSKTRYAG